MSKITEAAIDVQQIAMTKRTESQIIDDAIKALKAIGFLERNNEQKAQKIMKVIVLFKESGLSVSEFAKKIIRKSPGLTGDSKLFCWVNGKKSDGTDYPELDHLINLRKAIEERIIKGESPIQIADSIDPANVSLISNLFVTHPFLPKQSDFPENSSLKYPDSEKTETMKTASTQETMLLGQIEINEYPLEDLQREFPDHHFTPLVKLDKYQTNRWYYNCFASLGTIDSRERVRGKAPIGTSLDDAKLLMVQKMAERLRSVNSNTKKKKATKKKSAKKKISVKKQPKKKAEKKTQKKIEKKPEKKVPVKKVNQNPSFQNIGDWRIAEVEDGSVFVIEKIEITQRRVEPGTDEHLAIVKNLMTKQQRNLVR